MPEDIEPGNELDNLLDLEPDGGDPEGGGGDPEPNLDLDLEPEGAGGEPKAKGSASWRDALPEELRTDKTLERYEDVSDLAKAYKEARGLIGRRGYAPPAEDAPKEEWDAWFSKAGRPESPDKYEYDDEALDPEAMPQLQQVAHDAGMTQKQFEAMMTTVKGQTEALLQTAVRVAEQSKEDTVTALREEHGPEVQNVVNAAKRAIAAFPEARELFDPSSPDHAITRSPRFWNLMAKVGAGMREDSITGRDGGTGTGLESQIEALETHPAFADEYHHEHSAIIHKWTDLLAQKNRSRR